MGPLRPRVQSSTKSNDAFDGMQGKFFSSETAPEAILQKSFAEELLGKTPRAGAEEVNVADLAKPLLGKELTMQYAERTASTAVAATNNPQPVQPGNIENSLGAAYSVVSHQQKLTIVGVTDLDP